MSDDVVVKVLDELDPRMTQALLGMMMGRVSEGLVMQVPPAEQQRN
jgi:hypothetical protein